MLVEVYAKVRAADKYDGIVCAGRNKVDLKMQEDVFASWDRWV